MPTVSLMDLLSSHSWLAVLQFEIWCKVNMKRCLQPFISVSWQFVAILCFGKLVDNSYGFVKFVFIHFHIATFLQLRDYISLFGLFPQLQIHILLTCEFTKSNSEL